MLSFTLIYKTLFIAICTALFCLICYGKLFVFHKKEATFVSDYTSSIALFFTLYVIVAFIGLFIVPTILKKIIFLCLAISPFAIGHFAKYETEKYFTLVQLFVLVFSVVCVMRF